MTNSTNLTNQLVTPAASSFGVLDYVIFALFLSASGAIGIFFSCRGQKTTGEYFFGNRAMNPVPVGISTGVSFMSALSIVGFPAEMYNNGWSYMIVAVSGAIGGFISVVVVANIIHPLEYRSLNDYYRDRFNSKILSAVSNFMVLLCVFHYMGACMFGAVVAFNSITGGQVSIVLALIIGSFVGIFYTSIGGLKAVVWTDVLQCGIMMSGIVVVLIKSIYDSGGMTTIVEMNTKFERLKPPPMSFDLTIRHSLWSLTLGSSVTWASYTMPPAMVQRLASMKHQKDCYIVGGITSLVFMVFMLTPAWAGLNIFGYYSSRGCDVFAAGWIKNNDILMYYIRDRLAYPGFQGLFLAALYAGSLSSLSSGLSSASSIIWNDVLRPCFREEPSELKATLISKILVVLFGALSMLWSYTLISFGGMMLQVTTSTDAAIYGAYLSLFIFAILFRYANWKGAVVGIIASLFFTMWISVGSLLYGKSHIANLRTTTENCAFNRSTDNLPALQYNSTSRSPDEQGVSFIDTLYSVSYLWLSSICLVSFLTVALLVTACTKMDAKVDPKLLFPLCRPNFFCSSHEGEDNECKMQAQSWQGESPERGTLL